MSDQLRVRKEIGPTAFFPTRTKAVLVWKTKAREFFDAGEVIKGTPTLTFGYGGWSAKGMAIGYIKVEEDK
jgi:hypothetical protein